ncbi:unnamed protein product, partial [Effrenium voratum]
MVSKVACAAVTVGTVVVVIFGSVPDSAVKYLHGRYAHVKQDSTELSQRPLDRSPLAVEESQDKVLPTLTEPWVRQAIDQCSPEERSKHTKSWDLAMKTRLQKWSLKKPTGIQPSGVGSSVQQTAEVRQFLHSMFGKLEVRRFLDVPCGDMTWMSHMNLSGVEYMGGDISPSLIENNLMTFEDDPRFQGRFGVFDITCMVPPKVDLIHTRDVFIHIDSDLSVKALKNFEASGSKYIAVAHWPEDAGEKNEYHPTKFVSGVYDEAHQAQGAQVIGFHRFNLHLPPYCMPTPMYSVINGRRDGSDGVLGVWPLPALGRGSHPKCRPSLTEPWVRQAIDQCSPEERSKHTKSWDLAMKTRLQKWSLKKPTGIQPSGVGSSVQQTAEVRQFLHSMFGKLEVRRFLDVPCGDMTWMSHMNLSGVEYMGGDISPS